MKGNITELLQTCQRRIATEAKIGKQFFLQGVDPKMGIFQLFSERAKDPGSVPEVHILLSRNDALILNRRPYYSVLEQYGG